MTPVTLGGMEPVALVVFAVVGALLVYFAVVQRRRYNRADGGSVRADSEKKVVNYLIPDATDEPLTPQEMNVAGIGHGNRQLVIESLRVDEPILWVREPHNQHDRHAIALYRQNGQCIGYVPGALAESYAQRLDRGSPITSTVAAIEPFETERGRELLGVRLEVVLYKLKRQRKPDR